VTMNKQYSEVLCMHKLHCLECVASIIQHLDLNIMLHAVAPDTFFLTMSMLVCDCCDAGETTSSMPCHTALEQLLAQTLATRCSMTSARGCEQLHHQSCCAQAGKRERLSPPAYTAVTAAHLCCYQCTTLAWCNVLCCATKSW
jgi:hypothetical protein